MDAWDTKGITERFKFDYIETLKSEVEKINNILNEV